MDTLKTNDELKKLINESIEEISECSRAIKKQERIIENRKQIIDLCEEQLFIQRHLS